MRFEDKTAGLNEQASQINAIINILVKKGLCTRDEISAEIENIKANIVQRQPVDPPEDEIQASPAQPEQVEIPADRESPVYSPVKSDDSRREQSAAIQVINPSSLKLTIDGPLLDISGYAYFTRTMSLGLDKRGADVSIINKWFGGAPDINVVKTGEPEEENAIYLTADGKRFLYRTQVNLDKVKRVLELDNIQENPAGRTYIVCLPPVGKSKLIYQDTRKRNPGYERYIGYTMFEMADIPHKWIESCRHMDEIWVPSTFNYETFTRGGLPAENIKIVPLGVNVDIFDPAKTPPMQIPGIKGFNFLSTFQWSKRKGWDILLQAYLKSFSREDDVALVIRSFHTDGSSIETRIRKYIAHLGYDINKIPRIAVVSERIAERDMPSLYKACQAYVLPTRGEGWGLPFMEAMAMGLPAIATRFSAHLDFMNDENSYLIDNLGTEQIDEEQLNDNPVYLGTSWGIPSLEHTAELMRYVYDNRGEAHRKGLRAREDIKSRWTDEHQIDYTLKALQRPVETVKKETPVVLPLREEKHLRVLMQNRPNTFDAPGGDTVVMENLKRELEKLGVEVDISTQIESLEGYDLVHTFNFVLPEMVKLVAHNAMKDNKPFVVTTLYEDLPRHLYQSLKMAAILKEYIEKGQPQGDFARMCASLKRIKPHPNADDSFNVRQAAALMPCGETEARLLKKEFPFARRLRPVPFGCNIRDIEVGPELFFRETGLKDFVFCVGRLEARKNQLMLLKALENDDIPVVFASGGFTYQPKYVKLCQRFKRRGKTLFMERLSEEMLVSAYKAAKVHALPSWYELPGLVTLEAAYYGCNVVASTRGGLHDYLGDNVHYCEPDDEDSIRRAVMDALDSPINPALKELAAQFTWERTARETIKVYREVVEEHIAVSEEFSQAAKLRREGNSDEALNKYLHILDRMPDKLEALSAAGDMLSAVGDPKGKEFRNRLEINRMDSDRRFEIKGPLQLEDDWVFEENDELEEAFALIENDDYHRAETIVRERLEEAPSNHRALFALGRIHFLRGEYREAREQLEKSLDIQPEGDAIIALAETLEKLNQCDQAMATLDLLNEIPGINGHYDFDINRLRGHCLLRKGKLDEAESYYNRARNIDPASEKPFLGLGSAYMLKKDYITAERHLRKALELNPRSEKAHMGLGILYLEKGEAAQASVEINKTLEINPENLQALMLSVRSGHQAGDLETPKRQLERYLELHPANVEALYTLAGIRLALGDKFGARETAQNILLLQPNHKLAAELIEQIG